MKRYIIYVLILFFCLYGCSEKHTTIETSGNNTSSPKYDMASREDVEVIETYASINGDIANPDDVFEKANHVAIINILTIDGCSNVDQRNDSFIYPYTYGKAVVKTVYKGNLDEGQEIMFVRMGGTVSWEDYLNSLPENEREKTERLSKDNHPAYVREIFANDIDIEIGKTYLAYCDDRDVSIKGAYAIIGWQGGLREIVDGKVKNNFTGEFQELYDIFK